MRSSTRSLFVGTLLADVIENHGKPSNFPQLVGTVGQNARHTITTPAMFVPNDCRKGDLLIAILRSSGGNNTYTWGTGWTEAIDATTDASDDSVGAAYHVVTADEAQGFGKGDVTASTAVRCACLGIHLRGAGTPVFSSVTAATTTTINPPNCNPAAGSKDYLWIAVASCADSLISGAAPTNYTGKVTQDVHQGEGAYGGAASASLAVAFRELNAASEDPGAYGAQVNTNSMSFTIGVPPG